MRVMLDNSVYAHSQFAESAMGPQWPRFGTHDQNNPVIGFVRKTLDPNPEHQAQMDSLFTVGRLIRENTIEAFTYRELLYESMNRIIGEREFDAMVGCAVTNCPPALERSRFQMGNFFDFARKGGKKDRELDRETTLSQIHFMQWLCCLDESSISTLIGMKATLGLTDFEVESFQNLKCFQKLCAISQSPENYPDMFHLWTAQRNRMAVFLTLDKKLTEIGKHIEHSRGTGIEYPTKVFRPLELLRLVGVTNPDPVPIEPGQFYPLHELMFSQ
jgi:hypothetical protein